MLMHMTREATPFLLNTRKTMLGKPHSKQQAANRNRIHSPKKTNRGTNAPAMVYRSFFCFSLPCILFKENIGLFATLNG
jgi:hypothetical protein